MWFRNHASTLLYLVVALSVFFAFTATYYNFYTLQNLIFLSPVEAGITGDEQYESCEWGTSTFLIISDNVGSLVYYTHTLPLVISLVIGVFVLLNNASALRNRVFFLVTFLFAAWAYFDLVLWASPSPQDVMFFWSGIVPVEMFLYLFTLYLVYLFTRGKDARFIYKCGAALLAAPTVFLMHTNAVVFGLSPDCDQGAIEGPVVQYMYTLELFLIAYAIYLTVTCYKYLTPDEAVRARIFGIATIIFLCFFTAGNLTLMFDLGPNYEQYKLFGMPIFAAIVTYLIVRYKTFNTKLLATEALVIALGISVGSLLFVRKIENVQIIALITLAMTITLGILLVRSVRKEVGQREQIEKLAVKLEKANVRLTALDKLKSEFVSIASHQLRSPLTSIRGYTSLLLEGSYGKLPAKAIEPLTRINDSSKLMALSIEDYLNVSRIESGNMKYILNDFNLRDEVDHICDGLRSDAMKKSLILLFRTNLMSRAIVHADLNKTTQIIHNLINNAIKYTNQGSITVFLRDDITKKRIYVDIIDTGIGMSDQGLKTIFQKFERADNANNASVSGTGLGLYVALKMAEAMHGDITAHSDGEGKGSRFTLDLPLAM